MTETQVSPAVIVVVLVVVATIVVGLYFTIVAKPMPGDDTLATTTPSVQPPNPLETGVVPGRAKPADDLSKPASPAPRPALPTPAS